MSSLIWKSFDNRWSTAVVRLVTTAMACLGYHGAGFTANLGAGRNGFRAGTYTFLKQTLASRSGSYSSRMIQQCLKYNMKPVCDHPNYCRNDLDALYIGQRSHITPYGWHQSMDGINSWFPSGWSSISSHWDGLCSYTANANRNYALCNIPANTHSWRSAAQANPVSVSFRLPIRFSPEGKLT